MFEIAFSSGSGIALAEQLVMVFLQTESGGTRVLDMLVGDPLPRIC